MGDHFQANATHVFVRVQDELHGAFLDDRGVFLPVRCESNRNTLHFSVDSLVSDHAYGKFNVDANGDLKGKIVVVASPQELPTPSGLNQVDTWFRMEQTKHPITGEAQRGLNVGRATIIAPADSPRVEGADMVYYDGTLDGRNAAFELVMSKRNIAVQTCGFRSWSGFSEREAMDWSEAKAEQMYANEAEYIHTWMRDCSLDTKLETCGLDHWLERLRNGQRLHGNESGVELPVVEMAREKAQRDLSNINAFFQQASPADIQRCSTFYLGLKDKIEQDLRTAIDLQHDLDNDPKRFELGVREELDEMAGSGPFFFAKAGSKVHESLSTDEFAQRIVAGHAEADDLIWRKGLHPQWTKFSDACRRLCADFSSNATPPDPLDDVVEQQPLFKFVQTPAVHESEVAAQRMADLVSSSKSTQNLGGVRKLKL